MSRSLQALLYGVEAGRGRRWLNLLALLLFVFSFSLYLGHKRQAGVQGEAVAAQAVIARNLAEGRGFTTPVSYPQVVALQHELGVSYDSTRDQPELYQAPLYPLLLAGGLWLMGESGREWLFAPLQLSEHLVSFRADLYLVGFNIACFWITLALAWLLARRLFNEKVALLAVVGLLLSAGLWRHLFLLSGVPLVSALLLALFLLLSCELTGSRRWLVIAFSGLVCGLLVLADYTAAFILPAACFAYLLQGQDPHRWRHVAVLVGVASVVILPWIWRNTLVSELPFGLAHQAIAMNVDDPAIHPDRTMNSFSAAGPVLELRKFIRKGLSGIREQAEEGFWQTGAYIFGVLFLLSSLYRYRNAQANRLKWVALGLVISLILFAPFFRSGVEARPVLAWCAPLIIVFGAPFLIVLIDVLHERAGWQQRGWLTAFMALHLLPMLFLVAEPRRPPFSYPPYWPGMLQLTRSELMARRPDYFAIMADIPAGLSWYSGQRVWAQPWDYADFTRVDELQPVAAHLISPNVLDKSWAQVTDGETGWGPIYRAVLTGGELPPHPLRKSARLHSNLYLLYE